MEAKVNIKPDQGIRAGLLFTFAVGAAVSLGGCNNPTTPSPEASNKPTPPQIRTLRLPEGQPPTAIITPPLGSTLYVVGATQDGSGNYKSVTIKQCTVFKRMCSELTVSPESEINSYTNNGIYSNYPLSSLLDRTNLK
jgi:hypothetical protein